MRATLGHGSQGLAELGLSVLETVVYVALGNVTNR
jgi:hypothetical protein